jgi:hypothetical protein
MNERILVPVSPGELFDKKTILEIKSVRMKDAAKVESVRRELTLLSGIALRLLDASELHGELTSLQSDLLKINETLWDLENRVRALDRSGNHGIDFVESARAIYANNDQRAVIKRNINVLLLSELVEEKEHGDSNGTSGK